MHPRNTDPAVIRNAIRHVLTEDSWRYTTTIYEDVARWIKLHIIAGAMTDRPQVERQLHRLVYTGQIETRRLNGSYREWRSLIPALDDRDI